MPVVERSWMIAFHGRVLWGTQAVLVMSGRTKWRTAARRSMPGFFSVFVGDALAMLPPRVWASAKRNGMKMAELFNSRRLWWRCQKGMGIQAAAILSAVA